MNDSTYSIQWQFIQPWPILICNSISSSHSLTTVNQPIRLSQEWGEKTKETAEKSNNIWFDSIRLFLFIVANWNKKKYQDNAKSSEQSWKTKNNWMQPNTLVCGVRIRTKGRLIAANSKLYLNEIATHTACDAINQTLV